MSVEGSNAVGALLGSGVGIMVGTTDGIVVLTEVDVIDVILVVCVV